jgi:hypothetical protein
MLSIAQYHHLQEQLHVLLLLPAVLQDAEAAQKQFVQLRREHEALQNSVRSQVGQALLLRQT